MLYQLSYFRMIDRVRSMVVGVIGFEPIQS